MIFAIIEKAKKEKEKNPSLDYGARVIEISNTVWSNNMGDSRSTKEGFGLAAADPKARGEVTKAIDRTLKYAWKQEKNEPKNKEFWDNFESWHCVGGIAYSAGEISFEDLFTFFDLFKSNNPDELSGYGWDGRKSSSDDKKMNPGVQSVINTTKGWPEKFHVKLSGDVTFAAAFDITTQWLSYKEEDSGDFEKAGDFSKMLNRGKYGGLITGPDDDLLSGHDTYNEIVIKDSKLDGISVPNSMINKLEEQIGDHGGLGFDTIGRVISLSVLYDSLKNGDIKTAANDLIAIADDRSHYKTGYSAGFTQIKDYLLTGDIKQIKEDNIFIKNKNRLEKFLSYGVPIYENQSGKNITYLLEQYVDVVNVCMQPNPILVERRNVTVKEAIARGGTVYGNSNDIIKTLERFPSELFQNKPLVKFIFSDEGEKQIDRYIRSQFKKGIKRNLYNNPFDSYTEIATKILSNPKAFLNKKATEVGLPQLLKKDVPDVIQTCAYVIAYYLLDHYDEYKEIPNFGPIRQQPQNPFSKKTLKYDFAVQMPYYFYGIWTTGSGKKQSFQDKSTNEFPHQTDRKYFMDMVAGIVKNGGVWEKFMIWNLDQNKWENVNLSNLSYQEINTVLDSILIPPVPGSQYTPTGQVAETISINKKQLRNIIRKIL